MGGLLGRKMYVHICTKRIHTLSLSLSLSLSLFLSLSLIPSPGNELLSAGHIYTYNIET
jgi:hypothetical protein